MLTNPCPANLPDVLSQAAKACMSSLMHVMFCDAGWFCVDEGIYLILHSKYMLVVYT